ncbi:superoxide dismutase [Cu-Zn] SodC [Pseudomonas sp. Teo4]|uniref:superoxide dismutase [Cu-Zn] SodC n=1 Tax=Pseudomonas sp. Teo4 TaxID=3064528 RepID=UPI002ABA190F|nr:superoxide dismutase [Cu-Zn] SodC [Pseudomonas sp. Teo4]MDZ3991163.1 Superoxide dismutase [Cu-Zn] 1 [Pseudomonas sp. Teo4]
MKAVVFILLLASTGLVKAAQTVELKQAGPNGPGESIGTVDIQQNQYGTLLTPNLRGLAPGIHGFHLHQRPSCESVAENGKQVPAGGAGGHWDPDSTGAHRGPYADSGHRGDLPALYVAADGTATYPVLAPRLRAEDFTGHALMVHAGGDNHRDHPAMLGGGGARVACGVVR